MRCEIGNLATGESRKENYCQNIMEPVIRRVKIEKRNIGDFREKITNYLNSAGCLLKNNSGNTMAYGHSFSIFDSWRFNPLKRYYEIKITINEEDALAIFNIERSGQLDPVAEEVFWDGFIANFTNYYFNGLDFRQANIKAITEIKRSNYIYIGYALGGAILGGVIGLFIYLFSGSYFFSFLAVPVFIFVVLNYRNKNSRAKYLSR